jgi:hypothetical protein
MVIVIHFPFYAFSLYVVIQRNTTPVYNESHQYIHRMILKCTEQEIGSNYFDCTEITHDRGQWYAFGRKMETYR